MPFKLSALSDLTVLPFDDIIDVRSPSEFAEDHIPGAINLPALSDAERARVGTIYVQEDRFLARKIGAALVARNAADHLQGPLADRPGDWRPLVYCWRGGQRSGSFTSILQQIGWRAQVVGGGYKSYRRLVVQALYDTLWPGDIVLIDGGTGTAKTRLLAQIEARGGQVLDLEAMAEHRGSLFGPMGEAQPHQKTFESRLAMQMARLDPARPVFVEAESSKIGRVIIPPALWKRMIGARVVELNAPLEARVGHLVTAYDDLVTAPQKLDAVLRKLIRYHGHAQVERWQGLASAGDFATLAGELITAHYDPRYARVSRRDVAPEDRLDLPDLSDETLEGVARELVGDVH
ncbi:tRNA 2-selenouridine(34) synthase MnmH [Aliiroseovarius sp.]|uniref:tRNA 2-selenouridine(34) synthase MnmH n=1 Tax=Aliiroseovarius sp. TaxID=1872442 RepID=UPI0026102210|nr:tRNA 2-selenouridine(34) synthase MnmH [Aliiroseovarius sp.]